MIHFNTLSASLNCPYCGEPGEHQVKLAFGETRGMGSYQLGDRYPWRPGLPVERGGRPQDGDYKGESTSRCPVCHQVFIVHIRLQNDIIRAIEPERARQANGTSTWQDGRIQARVSAPEPARSQLDEDLIERVQTALEGIQAGGFNERSSETCLLLYDLGEALRQKGQIRVACQAFYNAYLMAARLELTGWAAITSEAVRELRQEFDLSREDCELGVPVARLLANYLSLLQANQA